MLSPYQEILYKLSYVKTLDDIWEVAVDFFQSQGITHIIYVFSKLPTH